MKGCRNNSIISLFILYASILELIGFVPCISSSSSGSSSGSDHELELAQNCASCRLTSQSMEDLIRKPRQMNAYGQLEERVDLDKIKKTICKDIISDKERENCRSFFFTNLETIEKWRPQSQKVSFFDFICIRELKYCCPRNSFGPRCTKCLACGNNQHCHGEGTRFGNGSCVCNEGHTGLRCASCKRGYHTVITKNYDKDKDKDSSLPSPSSPASPASPASSPKTVNNIDRAVVCKPCHRSCQYCRNEGPMGCEVCRTGFTWIPAYGCSDIDECTQNKKICGENTFCVNTEGSYFCYECDRACDGCHGDGPDMCLKCATGYKIENGNCVALKKTLIPPEVDYYRYAIYFGLSLCSCIISYNNIYLASLVGLGVALYVGFSEYVMTVQYSEMMKEMGASSS